MKTLVVVVILALVIAIIILLPAKHFKRTLQSLVTAWSPPANWSSYDFNSSTALRYEFHWIKPDATITVDLNTNDSSAAAFLEFLYYTQSKRLQITCPKSERFGNREIESGWYVCVAEPFNLVKPCLVYSFGMGDPSFWSFDEIVTKKYGCQEMAYDPTIGMRTSKVNKLMWFFNVGLSGEDGTLNNKWPVKTLETLLTSNKHIDRTIDILKIDIECSEWSAFDAILASPKCLSKVKQLLVEFHPCGLHNARTPHQFVSYWRTLRAIDRLGFKLWRAWNNHACKFVSKKIPRALFYGCFNAYYLNVNYLI